MLGNIADAQRRLRELDSCRKQVHDWLKLISAIGVWPVARDTVQLKPLEIVCR